MASWSAVRSSRGGVPRITAARIAYGPCSTQTVNSPTSQRIQRIVLGYAERIV